MAWSITGRGRREVGREPLVTEEKEAADVGVVPLLEEGREPLMYGGELVAGCHGRVLAKLRRYNARKDMNSDVMALYMESLTEVIRFMRCG